MSARRKSSVSAAPTSAAPPRSHLPLALRIFLRTVTSYAGFRWLLGTMLFLGICGVFLQWIVMPILTVVLPAHLFDFSYYYVAALALLENPHVNVYDPHVLPSVALAHHLKYVAGGRFDYPLLLPIALIPLALFSYQTAARIWFFFSLLLWMLNTALLTEWLHRGLFGGAATTSQHITGWPFSFAASRASGLWRNPWHWLRARWSGSSDVSRFAVIFSMFVCVSYAPMIEAQTLGQATMLMLTCFLLAAWFVQRGHPEIAGFFLTVATLIKIFPIVLIAYFFLQGRWRVVFGAAVSFVLLLVAMAAVVGVSGILSMLGIFSAVSTTQLSVILNESLSRMPMWIVTEFGGSPSTITAIVGNLLIAVVSLLFVITMLAKVKRKRDMARLPHPPYEDTEYERLGFSWAICTMLLVIPISQEHYDIWLLPAILFCVGYIARSIGRNLRDDMGRVKSDVMLMLGAIIALALSFYDLPFGYDGALTLSLGPYILGHPLRPIFMLARPIAALTLWLVVWMLFLRQRPLSQTPQHSRPITLASINEPVEALLPIETDAREQDSQSIQVGDPVSTRFAIVDIPWQRLSQVMAVALGALVLVRIVTELLASFAVATPR